MAGPANPPMPASLISLETVSLPLPPRVSLSVALSLVFYLSPPLYVCEFLPVSLCFSAVSSLSYPLSLCASHSVFVSLILGVSQSLSDQLSYVSLSHL